MNGIAVTLDRKELWNTIVAVSNGSFLQSWEWGEFQKSLGRPIWQVMPSDESENVLVIKYSLPLNKNYLYCPRWIPASNPAVFEKVKEIALQEKSIFVKIDPELTQEQFQQLSLSSYGFVKSFKQIQPKDTFITDLSKEESVMLQGMKPKTRYNIRLAQKKNLRIVCCESDQEKEKYFDLFWPVMQETARRNSFNLHLKEYYQKQLTIPWVKLWVAEYEGKIVAGAIAVFFGRRVTYLHGASKQEYKNLMAPYLLHWEIIAYAKKDGFLEYDWWGIRVSNDPKKDDAWAGITRFKTGFGGKEIHYAGAYDMVLKPTWYNVYKGAKKVLK